MSGLHTVPDAAEDQQLLLDVRALLERSQRQAAKNRALEAHREKVEATLGRVQEALGAAPRRRDGFEELDGDHELSAALRGGARLGRARRARRRRRRAARGEPRRARRDARRAALAARARAAAPALLRRVRRHRRRRVRGARRALRVGRRHLRPLRLWAGGPRRPPRRRGGGRGRRLVRTKTSGVRWPFPSSVSRHFLHTAVASAERPALEAFADIALNHVHDSSTFSNPAL